MKNCFEKLAIVLITFIPKARLIKKVLNQVPYIYYFIHFIKKHIWVLIDFESKINSITLVFTKKLDIKIRKLLFKLKKLIKYL